ncbi:hypothetical protein BDV40DRAFT_283020 [Aspergillus tamarii]|uniref:Uncharacterized protein n=1 Tax=Aspergillus tamarii TaxID=41984 RepID=A0A5N6UB34_ASPTM|nr:hypothetical protein BDV40DRAFT_283020 [Aspergillus tamarii]
MDEAPDKAPHFHVYFRDEAELRNREFTGYEKHLVNNSFLFKSKRPCTDEEWEKSRTFSIARKTLKELGYNMQYAAIRDPEKPKIWRGRKVIYFSYGDQPVSPPTASRLS